MQQLPETQRTALLLREIDALSYEQIALAMDTTVPSVKSLLVRARISLAEAAEARKLSCEEVRGELGEVAEGLVKISPPVRRHLRDCERCRTFRKLLKDNNHALAAVLPVGPLLLLKRLVLGKLGASAGAGHAAGAGSAGAGVGAASGASGGAGAALPAGLLTAGAGAGAAGGASAVGGLVTAGAGAIATKAAATLAAAALVTAGAVAASHPGHVRRHSATAAVARPAHGRVRSLPAGGALHAPAAPPPASRSPPRARRVPSPASTAARRSRRSRPRAPPAPPRPRASPAVTPTPVTPVPAPSSRPHPKPPVAPPVGGARSPPRPPSCPPPPLRTHPARRLTHPTTHEHDQPPRHRRLWKPRRRRPPPRNPPPAPAGEAGGTGSAVGGEPSATTAPHRGAYEVRRRRAPAAP